MQKSNNSDANSCSACEEITYILWNQETQCRVHRTTPLVPIRSQMKPVIFI